MAKIDINFNNNKYTIDESALSAASSALKSHLSSVMNGEGATINFDGVTYSIDSTKLTNATNAFVNHLGTIAGNGCKININGIEYNIDSAKMQSAIAELEVVLGGLGSQDKLNEYGFYFNMPYSGIFGGVERTFVFFEDGSYKYKAELNGEVVEEVMPAGSCVYNQNKIIIEGDEGTVTDSGTKINCGDGIILTLCSSSDDGSSDLGSLNEYGFYYDTKYSFYSSQESIFPEGETAFYFRENQTADIYTNGTFFLTLSSTYSDKTITIPDLGVVVNVMSNGKELYTDSVGIVKLGDSVFTDGDYTYTYCNFYDGEIGWQVDVNDRTKSSYGEIRSNKSDGYPMYLRYTFEDCTNLTTAPIIPDNVVCMQGAFSGCTNLTTAPIIPDSVKNMFRAFKDCVSLTTAPEIPDGVEDMGLTFHNCTNLATAPEIPSSVNNMSMTFYGCTNLTGSVVIDANITEYDYYEGCFYETVKPITITGSCSAETKAALAATANNGNVTY